MDTVFGLDLGTTTLCGLALAADGTVCATATRMNDAGLPPTPPGAAEQHPQRIRALAFEILRELIERAGPPAALAVTGQMHGMLCVGADGTPRGPLITWQDARAGQPLTPEGTSALDLLRARGHAVGWSACGCVPASGFLGTTLFWLRRTEQLPADTAVVASISDWLAATLISASSKRAHGRAALPTTDPTNAAGSGVFDVAHGHWHAELLDALDVPRELLPEVRPTGAALGKLSAAAARETGLPAGTPVFNGLGDNQASFLGSVAEPDAAVLVNVGTGSQVCWTTAEFRRVPGLETRPLTPERWLLVGASLCGGRAYAWLCETVRAWLSEFGLVPAAETVYARLNELAAAAPTDCGGLVFDTRLAGTRDEPALRGALLGVGLDNFTLGSVARGVLTGTVDELIAHTQRDPRGPLGPGVAPGAGVIAAGNAVRRSAVLRRVLAERCGRPVQVPAHTEEAAYGAALVAGVGAGVWPDLGAAAKLIRYEVG
jgi:sugar (pentulose or hexulose) kinase